MENNEPKFEILHMPPENTNSVLVSVGRDAVIFDAWGRAADWEKLLTERGLRLRAIYSTHGHSDHISAAPDLAAAHDVPWYMNAADNDLIMWGNALLDFFEMPHIQPDYRRPTDLHAGEFEILSGVRMQVIETPGHSAGGLAFYFPDFGILLTGDTLFRDSFGRYDLPGGNADILRASIAKLYDMNLPDETYVVHGHGVDSTIGILKAQNPFFRSRCCGCDCEKHGGENCGTHHCCCHGHNDCECGGGKSCCDNNKCEQGGDKCCCCK